MGLIMRRNLMAAKSGYTAKDYVQDGIVSHIDGIENRGYGDHREAEGTLAFVDLKGYLAPSASSIPNITLGSKSIMSSDSIHREFSAFHSITMEWGGIIHFGETTSWHGVFQLPNGNNIYGYFGGSIAGKCNLNINGSLIVGIENDISHHISIVYNNGLATVYFGTTEFGQYEAPLKTGSSYWFGYGYGGAGLETNFLRIYDRALAASEIAHNYAIDKARFGLI